MTVFFNLFIFYLFYVFYCAIMHNFFIFLDFKRFFFNSFYLKRSFLLFYSLSSDYVTFDVG